MDTVIDMGLTKEQKEEKVEELLSRAIEQVYPSKEALKAELLSGRRLRAYLGIDPTGPDIHVGHQSQLLKLRLLQELGHSIILLIGDFTAMIGDPTDKSAMRVKLTSEQVLANAESYKQQASKILDFDNPNNPVELRFNSEWLSAMNFADVLELASEFTVQQMLERDMFQRRLADNKPVGLHEFIYPIMQGWDSVCMDVDIEVGGSDQIFNMLTGNTLVRRHKNKQKFVIAGQLLVDPSGKKIGKTEGNMITLNDTPLDMFHKIMMWGDGITPHALELCSTMPMTEINTLSTDIKDGKLSGLDGKLLLAKRIVTDLHGEAAAKDAYEQYIKLTTKENELPIESLPTFGAAEGMTIIDILHQSGLCSSKSEARRMLAAGAVRINESTVSDEGWHFSKTDANQILQVGKKKIENFRRLV